MSSLARELVNGAMARLAMAELLSKGPAINNSAPKTINNMRMQCWSGNGKEKTSIEVLHRWQVLSVTDPNLGVLYCLVAN